MFLFHSSFEPGDSFVGFHSDTAAAVIMKVTRDQQSVNEDIKEQVSCIITMGLRTTRSNIVLYIYFIQRIPPL